MRVMRSVFPFRPGAFFFFGCLHTESAGFGYNDYHAAALPPPPPPRVPTVVIMIPPRVPTVQLACSALPPPPRVPTAQLACSARSVAANPLALQHYRAPCNVAAIVSLVCRGAGQLTHLALRLYFVILLLHDDSSVLGLTLLPCLRCESLRTVIRG